MVDRNLVKVLEQVIELIPPTETEFISQLRSIQHSASYAAPEAMYYWWEMGGHAFNENLPIPALLNDWQTRLVALWLDRWACDNHQPAYLNDADRETCEVCTRARNDK